MNRFGQFLVLLSVVGMLAVGCDSKKSPPAKPAPPPVTEQATPAPPTPAPEAKPVAAEPAKAPVAPVVPEPPAEPLGTPTGTFVDRAAGAELRFVCYNILWNSIFPEVSESGAEKFVRVMRALNPDVLALQEIAKPSWTKEENYREWSAGDVVRLMNVISPLPGGASWHGHQAYDNVIVSRYPLKMTAEQTKPAGDRSQAMALVDLPDGEFPVDLYVMNNHYKCCGGEKNDPRRQKQSDSIVSWIDDARTPGGEIDLPERTGFIVCGDLNIVGGFQPVQTLIDGDIVGEEDFGPDSPPDWDGTSLVDLHPLHNVVGPDDYTWRNDQGKWDPGRIDFVVYSDSVLEAVHKFILNTTTMSDADLKAAGLMSRDICVDSDREDFDHLPLVVDFRVMRVK